MGRVSLVGTREENPGLGSGTQGPGHHPPVQEESEEDSDHLQLLVPFPYFAYGGAAVVPRHPHPQMDNLSLCGSDG